MPLRPPRNRKEDILSAQEDYRSQFYKHYRREADEYDREFMEKHDEDLNTTLIFVSFVWCSGVRADSGHRLVCSLPSPRHSSSTSNLNSDPTPTTRPPPSSASLSTRPTIPPSETTFPPSHNGLVPHT